MTTMAFTTKFALDFMSQQRISQLIFRRRGHRLYESSRLPPQCKTQCRTRNISPVASTWPRERSHFQQHRTNAVSILENDDPKSLHAVEKAPSLNTKSQASKKSETLHSRVHYILKIPLGKIGKNNLAKARSFLFTVSKWHNEQGATLSEALLERLHEEQFTGGNRHVIIDSEMYNVCMDAWNKSNVNGEKIVDHVEAILKRMEERHFPSEEHHAARPDRYSYNCLINAYSKWEEGDSSDKAEGILEKMKTLAEEASSENVMDEGYESLIRPDEFTYNSLMNYYATRKNNHLSAQRAEDLLLQMSELSREGKIQLGTTSFNIVLKAWSNSGSGIHGAQRAESLLRMMMKLHRQGHENVRPDAVSFSTVISSYSKVDPGDASVAVEKTMKLLDEFEGSFIIDTDTNIGSCYNAAANMIVKSGSHDAVDRVKELMNRMKNVDALPGRKLETSIIEAYAILGSDDALRQGKEILLEMMDKQDAELENDSVVPFNILLNAILKGNSTKKIELAEELMAEMDEVGGNCRPDLQSYNMIISALSRSAAKDPEHEKKAVSFMRQMLKSYSNGYQKAKPDSFVFNCIISMLARSKQEWADDVIYRTLMAMESQVTRGNAMVIPDTITYNLVIGKLAKAGTKQNAKKVMKLLTSMEKAEASAPDIITYTNVLQILGKIDPLKAAEVASSYLERAMSNGEPMQVDRPGFQMLLLALSRSHKIDHALMARRVWVWMENSDRAKDDILDSGLCNLVLIAFSRTNDAKAPEEALSFLSERIQRFKSLHKEGDKNVILPTVVGFSAALVSLGKANRIRDALGLLEIMKALDRDEVPNTKPDEGCYNSILSHLARSPARNTAAQALLVVRRMKDDLGHISIASLNSAINNCSRTTDESPIARRKAVEIAFQMFQLGRESKSFDSVTFALMIRTCIKLTDDDGKRLRLVKPLFKLCAQNGLVSSMVMREMGHLKKHLIGGHQLPKEWTINVDKER